MVGLWNADVMLCLLSVRGNGGRAFMRRRIHWRCVRQRKRRWGCRRLYQPHSQTRMNITLIIHR